MGKMVINQMNKRGPPWLLVKMVFFIYGYSFGYFWEHGIYFMVLVFFDGRCLWCPNVYSIKCRISGLRIFST
jgi:hypothetical protein